MATDIQKQALTTQVHWVSGEVLQSISNELEVWYVVQDILRGWMSKPLRIGIPYGIHDQTQRYIPSNQETTLQHLNYRFNWETGTAKIVLWARENIKNTGVIELLDWAHWWEVFRLGWETRRLIEWVLKESHDFKSTQSLRRIPTYLNRSKWSQNFLRYSDIEWNVYYLIAPKITHGRVFNPESDTHKVINWLYREVDWEMKYYQVINSFQETGRCAKYAYLQVIDGEAFDNFVFIKLIEQELLLDIEFSTIAASWAVIRLDIDTLIKMTKDPSNYKTVWF